MKYVGSADHDGNHDPLPLLRPPLPAMSPPASRWPRCGDFDGSDVVILNWLDDHSRYLLAATAHRPVTRPDVLAAFRAVAAAQGLPASMLTDNGARAVGGSVGEAEAAANLGERDIVRLAACFSGEPVLGGGVLGVFERLWDAVLSSVTPFACSSARS